MTPVKTAPVKMAKNLATQVKLAPVKFRIWHNLEPEDLVALTVEAAAMAQVPLAGTDWWPGKSGTTY